MCFYSFRWAFPDGRNLGRILISRAAFVSILFLAPVAGMSEIMAEVTITDRSFPPVQEESQFSVYDGGEGGYMRASKQIGSVSMRMSWPFDKQMITDKFEEIRRNIQKVGAHAILATDYTIEKFTPAGYPEKATLIFEVLRFVDEPLVDLRSESDFKALLRAKGKTAAIEGIWSDHLTKQRVVFFADPAQPSRFLGVQFDNANKPGVPKGLLVADLRLKSDGWLVGHVTLDNFARYPVRFQMPTGDELSIKIKKCTNAFIHRAYPDKFPPDYSLLKVNYVKESSK
jgi:hypothetical protein